MACWQCPYVYVLLDVQMMALVWKEMDCYDLRVASLSLETRSGTIDFAIDTTQS